MNTFKMRLRAFKIWLLESNYFDHINTFTISEQRIATYIYTILLTIAILFLLIYTSFSIQQHTVTIESPSIQDFHVLQSSHSEKISCPCRTISIPYRTFMNIYIEFHPVCSSEFVSKTWSNALFFENASLYIPSDVRSRLSAQFQLLSSLCSLAQQIVIDELNNFLATQFISIEVISNDSLHIQIDALMTSLKNSIPASLYRSIDFIRQISNDNQAMYAIGSLSIISITMNNNGIYQSKLVPCEFNFLMASSTSVGFYTKLMPTIVTDRCLIQVNTNESLAIVDGFQAKNSVLESLLSSSLICLYDVHCLQKLKEYLLLNINISILMWSPTDQYHQNSTIEEIIHKLFIHQWNFNVSYDSFFMECSPMTCSYIYSRKLNIVYILATLLGFYGGLTITLEFFVVLAMKYWHYQKINSNRIIRDTLIIKLCKLKQSIIESNLFVDKEKFTITQQRWTTWIFFVLLFSMFISYNLNYMQLCISYFLVTIFLLLIFSTVTTQIYIGSISSPSQQDFETLKLLYSDTLSCPCSQMITSHKDFINFEPIFHSICSSDLITNAWINAMRQMMIRGSIVNPTDIRSISTIQFPQINTFCKLAKNTIDDLLTIFNKTSFISQYALSNSTLHLKSNQIIINFQQYVKDLFSLQIKYIQNMFRDNQIYFSALSNGHIYVNITGNISNVYFQSVHISDLENCSCILNSDSCFTSSSIYIFSNSILIKMLDFPTYLSGCFAIDSLFQSTLECFYNQTCIDALQVYISTFTMTILNISETSYYTPYTTIGDLVNNLFVEKWNPSISFENYYSICAPQLCTYTYEKRANILYFITTLAGLFGGLAIALRILSALVVLFAIKLLKHNTNQNHVPICTHCKMLFRSIPLILFSELVSLNLFKRRGQQQNSQRTRFQIQTTRLYLSLLITILSILGMYRIISVNQFRKTILNPSSETYEYLYNRYAYILNCPCNKISMSYSQFIDIQYILHPICSSEFIQQTWFNAIAPISINQYPYIDFRGSAISFFQILRSLCHLANETIVNSLSSFLIQQFLSKTIISSIDFKKQIQVAIDIFQSNTRSNYIQSIKFNRDTISGNALVTIYSSSWKYHLSNSNSRAVLFAYPMKYDHENGTCSCGTNGDCSQPAAIYINNKSIHIPGIRVGCYPLNSVLQSTLECFYNQQCIQLLTDIFNISQVYTTFENSVSNQFNINTTVYSLANQLFINNWQANNSYEKYFHICAASTCSYSYSQRANFIYAFITLIGLYGGLSISLRLLSPIIVNIFKELVKQLQICNRNEVLPTIA